MKPRFILGEEVCVPKYGVGRIVTLDMNRPTPGVFVKTYADQISRRYDPANVSAERLSPQQMQALACEFMRAFGSAGMCEFYVEKRVALILEIFK